MPAPYIEFTLSLPKILRADLTGQHLVLGDLTPNDADYLVGTAHAGLINEIIVGVIPGGELGGTWAAPTIDTVHSGSSHAGIQSAAEATAQAALDAHTTDAVDAHDASAISILDTGNDFTATDVEAALAELQSDAEADVTALSDHIADAADAHDASAISILDTAGDFTAIEVEGALAELQSDAEAHIAAADPHTGYRLESADHSHQSTGLQGGQLDHGLALTGLTDDDHTQYVLRTENITGWIPAGETWTYVSASTFTVPTDLTARLTPGLKIKLTNSTVKYFYVISSSYSDPNTTVTITGGTDYTLANAAISANFYSYSEIAQGFPGWFTFLSTMTGSTGSAGAYAETLYHSKFCITGKMVSVLVTKVITNKGSWATDVRTNKPISTVHSLFGVGGYIVAQGTITNKGLLNNFTTDTYWRWASALGTANLAWAAIAVNDWVVIETQYPLV